MSYTKFDDLLHNYTNLKALISKTYRNGEIDPQNYIDTAQEKLEQITMHMGIDMSKYQGKNNRYEIPIIIAELFKTYLLQDSTKGSLINKLKTGKHDQIEYLEIENLIHKFCSNLIRNYPEIENIKQTVDSIEMSMLQLAEYIEYKNSIKRELLSSVAQQFDETCLKLFGRESYAKVVAPSTAYKDEYTLTEDDMDQYGKDLSFTEAYLLNPTEKIELLDKLLTYSEIMFKSWAEIVNYYAVAKDCEILAPLDSMIDNDTINNRLKIDIDKLIGVAENDWKKFQISRYQKPTTLPEESKKAIEEFLATKN